MSRVYKIHLINGPHDGQIIYAFRRYFQLTFCEYTYEALDDVEQWVDDKTREISLYYQQK